MQSPPTLDTPENWDAASLGYAEKVAPVLMRAYADELVERDLSIFLSSRRLVALLLHTSS